jgi:O-antigen ligase
MDYLQWIMLFSIPCLVIPIKYLILLGVVGVGMADSKMVSAEFMYYLRFMPMGILCLRILAGLKAKRPGWNNLFFMVKIWLPFLGFALFSVMFAREPSLAMQRILTAIFVLMGFGMGIPLYFRNTKKMLEILYLLALVMGAGVLYSLSFASGQQPTSSPMGDYERLSGIFKNPNTLGILCMQLFFVLIYLYQKRRDKILGKLILPVILAVGTTMVASGSRASAVGCVVGLIVFIGGNSRTRRGTFSTVSMVILMLISIFLVAGYFLPAYSGGLFRTDTAGRSVLWERAWEVYADGSILGAGFGNGLEVFAADAAYLRSIGIYAPDPHNSFLHLLVELGFIGLGLTLAAFALTARRTWKCQQCFDDPDLGVALSAVIAGSLVNSFFETWLFSFGNSATVPFWLFLGMLSHQTDMATMRAKQMAAMVRYREGMLFSSANTKRRKVVSVSTLNGKKRLQQVCSPRA